MAAEVSILKTARTYLSVTASTCRKGVLHLTTASLLFIPDSKKLPEARIPLDAIDTLGVPSKVTALLWVSPKFIMRGWYPLNIKTIGPNAEKIQFYIPDAASWVTAIKEAADRYFSCLKDDLDRVDKFMDQGKEKEALALCEETIKTCRDPRIGAYAYVCLATVQRRRGKPDKAEEALNRAKAMRDELCNGEELEGMFKRMTFEFVELRFGLLHPVVPVNEVKTVETLESNTTDKKSETETLCSGNDAKKTEERLKALQSLRDKGLISEAEYLKKRENVIKEI